MKNVPDELLPLLRNAEGDLPLPGSGRWGKVLFLHTATIAGKPPRPSVTFIQTEILPVITPMAVSLRFSLDGLTFTPAVPAAFGGTVLVEMIETIDMKTGAFRESFALTAGQTQPFCGIICRALNLSVTLDGENTQLYVQAVAAPTTTIDCADVVGPGGTTPAFSSTLQQRVAAAGAVWPAFVAVVDGGDAGNPDRQQFSIQNNSTAPLLVSLSTAIDGTPGSEVGSFILPGGISAIQSSDIRYTGPVKITWLTAPTAGDFALYTSIVSA